MIRILLIIFIISSCSMAPKYKRPESPVENEITNTNKKQDIIEKTIAISWQDFFKSPKLRVLIEKALENNRDLRIASLNVKSARELYRIQRSELSPNVSLGVGGSKQRLSQSQNFNGLAGSNSSTVYNSNYTANIAASAFELDLFGMIKSKSNSALESYFALDSAQEAVKIALISQVANSYLQMLSNKENLKLSIEVTDSYKISYELIKKRVSEGLESKIALETAKIALERSKINNQTILNLLERDKNALILLVGKGNLDLLKEEEKIDDIVAIKTFPARLSSKTLLLRPDIKQSEHELKSKNADIGAARAAFFPTISLTSTYGFASNSLSNLFSGESSNAWNFAPEVSLPIFRAGSIFANFRFSKTQKKIAIANYEKAIQIAFKEVADELSARKSLDNQLYSRNKEVEASENLYYLSHARYKSGIDGLLQLMDSKRSLILSKQNRIETKRQHLSNLINLYKVLGGRI